jgi:hypothetical protein
MTHTYGDAQLRYFYLLGTKYVRIYYIYTKYSKALNFQHFGRTIFHTIY